MTITPDEIRERILKVFRDRFEIDNPNQDENLREAYEFDSIDAIDLLREIELMLGTRLTIEQKKAAMNVSTINQIVNFVSSLV